MAETVFIKPNGIIHCPRKIPVERNNSSRNIDPLLVAIFIAGAILFNGDVQQVFLLLALMVISLCLVEFMIRVSMCCEELSYVESRYDGSTTRAMKNVFTFSIGVTITCIASFIAIILLWKPISNEFVCFILLLMAIFVILPYAKLKQSPVYESIEIATNHSLDFGTGMAISFFFGYLKIVLPATGSNDRGIKSLMDVYEAREHIKFVNRVLYVLIPLSMHAPPRLSDLSAIMEEAASLDPIEEDVAGVRNRNYKNSIYKIKHDGGYYYIAAEFASPLRTFLKATESSSTHTASYIKHKKEILWNFYTSLKNLVKEDPDVRGLVEFIYYDDLDENGLQIDIGKVLLQQLVRDEMFKKKQKANIFI